MNDIPEKSLQCVSGGGRWRLPAIMSLAFPLSVSALCIMSTILKHDWVLCAVSLCGPLALGAGVSLLLKSQPGHDENTVLTEWMRDQVYRSLLILSAVYLVTYTFFYGAIQLLMKAEHSCGGL
jgi:hypothetical protein